MNPACQICGGACCKFIGIRLTGLNDDNRKWLGYHATKVEGDSVEFPIRCKKLVGGRCSVYEDRPEICKRLVVGSVACHYAAARALSDVKYQRMVEAIPSIFKQKPEG